MSMNEQQEKLFKRAYELIKNEDSFQTNPYKTVCDLTETIPTVEAYYGCLADIITACGSDNRRKASFTLFPLSDLTFNIDLKKRTITLPRNQQVSVEGDRLSTTIIFTVDRFYELIDLAKDVNIKIYYQIKDTLGVVKCYTVNLIDDINFTDKIRFGWILDDESILKTQKDIQFYISFEKQFNRVTNAVLTVEDGKIATTGDNSGKVVTDNSYSCTKNGILINKGEVLQLTETANVDCIYSSSEEASTSTALSDPQIIPLVGQEYESEQDTGYLFFNIPRNKANSIKYTIKVDDWCLNTLSQEISVERQGFEIVGTCENIDVPVDYSIIPNSSEIVRGYVANPVFTNQLPTKIALRYNKPVTLKVSVENPQEGFIKYEWKKNGVRIDGATSNNYTIDESGSYAVTAQTIISNNNKSDAIPSSSVVADYVQLDPPIFMTNLPNKIVSDEPVTLTVTTKTPEEGIVKYQWYKNGAKINGATSNTETIIPTDTNLDYYSVKAQIQVAETSPYNSIEKPSATVCVSKSPVPLDGESNETSNSTASSGIYTLNSDLRVPSEKLTNGTEYFWYYSKTKTGNKNSITSATPWVQEGLNTATLKIVKNALPQFLYIWCEGRNIANGEKSALKKSKTFIVSP